MGSFFLFSVFHKEGGDAELLDVHELSFLFRYPFERFLVNEFSGVKCLEERFGECVLDGNEVLRKEGLGWSRWKDVGIMLCFILVYRFGSYVIPASNADLNSKKEGWVANNTRSEET
ncbi:hypothetical protein HPP92_024900 [Vanilla planifolia]|uniref:Uncharacterized protein n=1 Tax=Vanilla planifolia TaxID=51239 RepID=A0A835PIN0_VANPL|nr:hypothetical protein HPP92_025183 [Vanilla planifolia]KAG0453596.1 hypothetical protein HPP92_024900 [Vanilla planifolia]